MLSLGPAPPARPVNDSGTCYPLDQELRAVLCDRTEWEAFRNSGTGNVAATFPGAFASVVTTFEGMEDCFDEAGEPHLFLTMVHHEEHEEAEGRRSWHDAEAAHRARVDELKALHERRRRARDPQPDLL